MTSQGFQYGGSALLGAAIGLLPFHPEAVGPVLFTAVVYFAIAFFSGRRAQ